jgi:L-2-hydroxyglutarate oxidase
VKRDGGQFAIETNQGTLHCRNLINAAACSRNRIARLCGLDPKLQIIPFRGEYYEIVPEKAHLVRNLIYPVRTALPFLGVHFTRMAKGGVEAGPTQFCPSSAKGIPAGVSPAGCVGIRCIQGFWACHEVLKPVWVSFTVRSLKKAFTRALQRLLPDLREEDLRAGGRACARRHWSQRCLVDDFRIVEAERMVHVLNAPPRRPPPPSALARPSPRGP